MYRADQLDIDRASVLVIDLQEKILALVHNHEEILRTVKKLLDGTNLFDIPTLATEQYPKGIGPTHKSILHTLNEYKIDILEKPTFSAWSHPPVREAILQMDRPQVIVVGIETHVCIQQTVLDLLSRDYDVFVCADAMGSRGQVDHEQSLQRMSHAGAFVTTVESVLFELCHRIDTEKFKDMLEVIKSTPPENLQ